MSVGQKKVLPKPYKVANTKIIARPSAAERKNNPIISNKKNRIAENKKGRKNRD